MDLNQPASSAAPRPDDAGEWSEDPKVTVHSMTNSKNVRLMVEAPAAGIAFGSVLWWVSTCLVGTFRPQDLPNPYWDGMPWLRTDTSGFVAFFVAAISLTCSEYLRLSRRQDDRRRSATAPSSATTMDMRTNKAPALYMLLAVSETVTVLATALVGYLSLNAITHPESLQIHVSHLLPWPAEGTLRVVALALCVCSVAVFRYLRPLASSS
jgi:hypothetical protein